MERKWAGDADCGAVDEGEGKQQKKAEENMTQWFKVPNEILG